MPTPIKKILIADDDPINLHSVTSYIKEAGYSYLTAENGQIAWEILTNSPNMINLVIRDRIMPKLHVIQLLANMQQHPLLKNIPLIMLTGEADKIDVIEATLAGVKDFLYKPIDKDLLLLLLKRYLPC